MSERRGRETEGKKDRSRTVMMTMQGCSGAFQGHRKPTRDTKTNTCLSVLQGKKRREKKREKRALAWRQFVTYKTSAGVTNYTGNTGGFPC
ncbi:hypothetical protein NPIL_201221 [Nephila pilipes]|uniref:Uncharacterized protein n=1 Tax=Nephila pilipes TaxID=299642 RepID=A0A8X6TGT6_NEPPI|nr:hypothetical protein NPIL_201221 [Nephila pilipes]